jgi:type IV pilus assembly protein PilN
MIEINLLPGAKRKRGGMGVGISLPNVATLVGAVKDPWLVAAVGLWALVLVIGGPLYVHRRADVGALVPKLEAAKRDSMRLQGILNRQHQLVDRRDSLLAEIRVIRDIDRDRYVWPHILEAITGALPDYTWLDDLAGRSTEGDTASTSFTIRGTTAGEAQAVTRFMRNLEDSPFIQGVTLVSSAMVSQQGNDLTSFTLTARYQEPPPSMLTMVPLGASVVRGVRSGGGARR